MTKCLLKLLPTNMDDRFERESLVTDAKKPNCESPLTAEARRILKRDRLIGRIDGIFHLHRDSLDSDRRCGMIARLIDVAMGGAGDTLKELLAENKKLRRQIRELQRMLRIAGHAVNTMSKGKTSNRTETDRQREI